MVEGTKGKTEAVCYLPLLDVMMGLGGYVACWGSVHELLICIALFILGLFGIIYIKYTFIHIHIY